MATATNPDLGSDVDARPGSRMRLSADKDEILHLVCCRDPDWSVAFCGEPSDHINLAGTVPCSMCIEVALQRRPGCLSVDPPICPNNGERCPDEHEIDLRILHEVSP